MKHNVGLIFRRDSDTINSSLMLDPISVNYVVGPEKLGPCNQRRSPTPARKRRSIRRAGDRGEVERNPESIRYKKKSKETKEDTEKTLERTTHTHQPHFTPL